MCAPTRPPRPRTRAPRRPAARGATRVPDCARTRTTRRGRGSRTGGWWGDPRVFESATRNDPAVSRGQSPVAARSQSPSVCRGAAAQRYRTNVTTDVPLDKNVLALRSHSPFRSFRYHRPPCDPYAETADATMAIMLAYCSQHLGLHRCVHSCVGSLRHAKPIPSRYACRLSGSSPRAFALRCASHQRAKSEVSPSTLATSVWPCSS